MKLRIQEHFLQFCSSVSKKLLKVKDRILTFKIYEKKYV